MRSSSSGLQSSDASGRSTRARPSSPSARQRAPQLRPDSEQVELAFVPGAGYVLVELDATPLSAGLELEVDDDVFVVTRIGALAASRRHPAVRLPHTWRARP